MDGGTIGVHAAFLRPLLLWFTESRETAFSHAMSLFQGFNASTRFVFSCVLLQDVPQPYISTHYLVRVSGFVAQDSENASQDKLVCLGRCGQQEPVIPDLWFSLAVVNGMRYRVLLSARVE